MVWSFGRSSWLLGGKAFLGGKTKRSAVRRSPRVELALVLERRELLSGGSFLPSNPDVARNNGPQSQLVVRANFQDATLSATEFSDENIRTAMSRVNDFHVRQSFGKLSFPNDQLTIEPTTITLPFTKTQIENAGVAGAPLDPNDAIHGEAESLLTVLGYNLANYLHVTVIFPNVSGRIGYAGLAQVPGQRLWMNGNIDVDVWSHELGHNAGAPHVGYFETTDSRLAIQNANQMTYIEGGTGLDVMGGGGTSPSGDFFVMRKAEYGWLDNTQVVDVTASGTYRLNAHDEGSEVDSRDYAIQIARNAGQEYWLEYRVRPDDPNLDNGLVLTVRTLDGTDEIGLIDTTPDSHPASFEEDRVDAPLALGRTFSDPSGTLHITPTARHDEAGNSFVDVVVNCGNFAANSPPTARMNAYASTVPRIIGSQPFHTGAAVNLFAMTADPDGDQLVGRWDFGDGASAVNSLTPTHTWTQPGDYELRFTVTDMKGGQAEYADIVHIGRPTFIAVSAAGQDRTVNADTTGDQTGLAVASNGGTQSVVVWTNSGIDPSGPHLTAQRFVNRVPAGTAIAVSSASSGTQSQSAVAMDGSGNFVVAWQGVEGDDTDADIYLRRFSRDGTPLGDDVRINTELFGDQQNVSIAMSPSGEFVVVWSSNVLGDDIHFRRFAADGTPSTVNEQSLSGGRHFSETSAAMADDGSFLLVWTSDNAKEGGTDQSGEGIFAQRFSANGTAATSIFQVNTTTSGDQRHPDVVYSSFYGYSVVWESEGQDGDGAGIVIRTFSEITPATAEVIVNQTTVGDQNFPHVSSDAFAKLIVTWRIGPDNTLSSGGPPAAGDLATRLFSIDYLSLTDYPISDETILDTQIDFFSGADVAYENINFPGFLVATAEYDGNSDTDAKIHFFNEGLTIQTVLDFANVPVNTPAVLDVLRNDQYVSPVTRLSIATAPQYGSAIVFDNGTPDNPSDDTVHYTPNTSFQGTDTFAYRVQNALGLSAVGFITIAVGPPQYLDFGDAPLAAQSGFAASYPTLLADNGARHAIGGPSLGQYGVVDDELDGQPSFRAQLDDDISYDEDGIQLAALLKANSSSTVIVKLQNAANAKLDAWIDWNQDGDWTDSDEQILASQPIVAGDNSIDFSVPAMVPGGLTYARFRVSSVGGLAPNGLALDGEVEDYVVRVKAAPTTTAPDDLLIYYGYPSLINGANGDLTSAAAEFAKYDFVVLGDGLELPTHPDFDNAVEIMNSATTAHTQFFGYVDAGVSTQNLSISEIVDRIYSWASAGADGIFFDDFGYDFGTDRDRQNNVVGIARGAGLQIIVNGFRVEDVFSDAVDETYNPAGQATQLNAADYYLFESYQIETGAYVSGATWRTKADALAVYRASLGIQVLAVTTNDADNTFSQSQFDYGWYSALLDGYEGFGWGEFEFGSADSISPLRPRPSVDPGISYLSGVTTSGNAFRRTTSTGTVTVDPSVPIASFENLVPDIVMNSVTANGKTVLTVNYEIQNTAIAGPLTLRFVQSADAVFGVGDTLLSNVTISSAADLTVGSHSKTFTIGSLAGQVKLPGAGVAEPTSDYFILAVADPMNTITEADSDPVNEDNTVAFVGAYSIGSVLLIQGGTANDVVGVTYPTSTSGRFSVQLGGSVSVTHPYLYSQVTQFRIRTHAGADSVIVVKPTSITARPMLELGGDGTDVLNGSTGADTLFGGTGDDILTGDLGNDTLNGESGFNMLMETANVNFTLTNSQLTGVGTDTLVNIQVAVLEGGSSSNSFTLSGWSGDGQLIGGGGTGDTVVVSRNVNFDLRSDGLITSDGSDMAMTGISNAKLTGGESNNSFTIGTWPGTATLTGSSGTDLLIVSRDVDMTLSNTSLAAAGFGTLTLGTIETVTLYGGASNNILRANAFTAGAVTLDGGEGNDVLIGGSKNDLLNGGSGRDILIGGLGADRLAGASEDDILIGGTCTLSGTISALNAIRNEWTSGNSYATRVANLTNGGGANGTTKLNSSTVKNDSSVADRLAGNAKLDWFFQSASDVLVDFSAGLGEIKTAI